jgi:hypothetical protein
MSLPVPTAVLDLEGVPEALLALAPLHLPNHRQIRYFGDDQCISIESLDERDRFLARRLYDLLTSLLLVISAEPSNDARRWREVLAWVAKINPDALVDEVRELGAATRAHHETEAFAKALHDVRGGALSALLGRLQLLDHIAHTSKNLQALFVLARDHQKIMRNALIGLDDRRREEDRSPHSHDVQLILQKWHESIVSPRMDGPAIQMFVDCRHEGALTECCLECAAIDRIFYNLANNACRHAAGERMDMAIFPVPEAPGDCLRFVLSNPVGGPDADFLRGLPGAGDADETGPGTSVNLNALFNPKVSSTGSGFGLTVVADFVAGAFGLSDRREALKGRYVGAELDGGVFRAWFHWPIAHSIDPVELDDYHHPRQILSHA